MDVVGECKSMMKRGMSIDQINNHINEYVKTISIEGYVVFYLEKLDVGIYEGIMAIRCDPSLHQSNTDYHGHPKHRCGYKAGFNMFNKTVTISMA